MAVDMLKYFAARSKTKSYEKLPKTLNVQIKQDQHKEQAE